MSQLSKLLANFEKCGVQVLASGGDVVFAWPTRCRLWKHRRVKRVVKRFNLKFVGFHGCALGLASTHRQSLGGPTQKGQTVATTCQPLIDELSKYQRTHKTHASVTGKEPEGTGKYTPQLAAAVHKAWRIAAGNRELNQLSCSPPVVAPSLPVSPASRSSEGAAGAGGNSLLAAPTPIDTVPTDI